MSDKMREALKLAIRQNEHDMLMTGEELRLCRDAIAQAEQRTEAVIDTCDHGHKYAKLPGHPMRDGKPRCPHCMATGLDAARAEQRGDTPEDRAEQFIRAAIDRAPEPLRRLGEYLTSVLDDEEWRTAEPMLLGAAEQLAQGEAVAQIVNGELMWFIPHHSYALDAKFRSGRWMLYTATPAPVAPTRTTKDWCTTMAQLEAGHSVTAGCYAKPLADACRIPPDSWLCTREPGHDGPCAAVFHAPPAPAVPDDVARDAARYRALLDDPRCANVVTLFRREWNEAIDAIIAAAPEVPRG